MAALLAHVHLRTAAARGATLAHARRQAQRLVASYAPPPTPPAPSTGVNAGTLRDYDGPRFHVPITAYYVGREVDFAALARDYGDHPTRLDSDSLIVHLGTPPPAPAAHHPFTAAAVAARGIARPAAAAKAKAAAAAAGAVAPFTSSAELAEEQADPEEAPNASFAVVYDFGSLVLFNVPPDDHARHISLARKRVTVNPRDLARTPGVGESVVSAAKLARGAAPVDAARQKADSVDLSALCSDSFGVVVCPALATWCEFGESGELALQRLDAHNVSVIASVLAQSVALDHYANRVDGMLEEFKFLNYEMERTGSFTMRRERLFQIVATVNAVLADVITRLGVLERSDTAWKFANYERVWDGMRSDFEIHARFDALNTKMSLIQDNVKYFLEVLQNRKSDTLEWIIIILISAEICVSLFDISTRAPGL